MNKEPANAIHTIDGAALRAYLVNVADTLRNAVRPELSGKALARTDECITVLARLAARATVPNAGAREAAERSAELAPAAREGAVLDAEEVEYQAIVASLAGADTSALRTFDRERFERWLRGTSLGGAELRIIEADVLQGGRSKLTVRLHQRDAANLPPQFILRQDWASSVTGTTVVPEFGILQACFAAALRVPQPLLLEAGTGAMGKPFLLVGALQGRQSGDLFDPPPSKELALQLAEQLGRLHGLGAAPFAALPDVPECAYTQDQLRADLDGYRQSVAQLGESCLTIELAFDWLDRKLDRVSGPRTLVHGDLGFHNFLVDGETLSGILDWELAHLGHPAEDLGYLRAWVQKMIPWDHFVDAYHAAGGPDSGAFAIDFYTLFGGVRLYALLLQARAAIVGGMLRDCEIALCCAHLIPVLVHRMSCELRAILARS